MTEPLPQPTHGQPRLNERGDLVIPFACTDDRYKYWKKEGFSLAKILEELGAPEEVLARYLPPAKNGETG